MARGPCRPLAAHKMVAAAWAAPRRQKWRFAANSALIAKERPIGRKKEAHVNQSILRPFNQALHKLVWVGVGKQLGGNDGKRQPFSLMRAKRRRSEGSRSILAECRSIFANHDFGTRTPSTILQ